MDLRNFIIAPTAQPCEPPFGADRKRGGYKHLYLYRPSVADVRRCELQYIPYSKFFLSGSSSLLNESTPAHHVKPETNFVFGFYNEIRLSASEIQPASYELSLTVYEIYFAHKGEFYFIAQ